MMTRKSKKLYIVDSLAALMCEDEIVGVGGEAQVGAGPS